MQAVEDPPNLPAHTGGRRQGCWWLLTIPVASFMPYLPPGATYIKGQMEEGEENAYRHWQVVVHFGKKASLATVLSTFGHVHAELSRSAAALDYVWKQQTRIEG